MNLREGKKAAAAGWLLEGKRIGVVYGGPSSEREVSLDSGDAVASALEDSGLRVLRLVVEDEQDAARQLDREALDVAFIALHGRFGEDGGIQRLLDVRGIPYTGSGPLSSRVCIDKAATKRLVQTFGLPTPRYELLVKDEWLRGHAEALGERVGYPLVVKPNRAGSSLGVTIVRDPAQLSAALDSAFAHDASALLEAFVEGRELTVGILDGEALPVVEVTAEREFYDYQAKYQDDATRYTCPAELDPISAQAARTVAELAFELLHCRDLARVDLILPHERQMPRLIEVNTIPGFTGHSLLPKAARARGIDFADLCRRIAAMALHRAQRAAQPLRQAG